MKFQVKLPEFFTRDRAGTSGTQKPPLSKRLRGKLGWLAAGVGLFFFFVWMSLPTRAIAWRISHEAKIRGFLVDIADISFSPFGGVTLEQVTWSFKPTSPEQMPGKFFAEEVDIDIGVFALLFGDLEIEVEVEREEGRIYAEYEESEEASSIRLQIEELPLYDVPKAAQALNAPLEGLLNLDVDLTLPQRKLAKASGTIDIACSSCRIGDDEAKLFIPGSKAFKSGVTIPQIDFGTLTGKMAVDGGKATITEPIETESEDLRIQLTGDMALKDPFARSRFNLLLKVDVTEALQERSERIRFMVQTADPKTKLEPPETGMGFKLSGTVASPRFLGVQAKSVAERRADRRAALREREERRRKREAERAERTSPPTPSVEEPSEPEPREDEPAPDERTIDIQPLEPPPPEMGDPEPPMPADEPPMEEEPQIIEEPEQVEQHDPGDGGPEGAGDSGGQTGDVGEAPEGM